MGTGPDASHLTRQQTWMLSRADVLAILDEIAGELEADGPPIQLVLAGGAAMALLGLRDSSCDFDAINAIDDELAWAAEVVGEERGFRVGWLNSRARAFVPFTFDPAGCRHIHQTGRLTVDTAQPRDLWLMKMNATRPHDLYDAQLLWPLTGWRIEDAADALRCAYPNSPQDPHLEAWIRHTMTGR